MKTKTQYILMQEIVWPRQMLEEISNDFVVQALKKPSKLRKFIYAKQEARIIFDKFMKYHDGEISRKSWTVLFKRGFKMKCNRQNGNLYFYSGPITTFIINKLLDNIPQDGGFHFDGRNQITIIKSITIPKDTVPIINPEIEIKEEEVVKSGQIVRG